MLNFNPPKLVPSFSTQLLTELMLDLTSGTTNQDRFNKLLTSLRQVLKCDSSALLRFKGDRFSPLAIEGLDKDVLGREFLLSQHPRLEAIARAGGIVRFPADSDLPDPYDGLIEDHPGNLKVHACVGLPLFADEQLIGAVTLDDFNPNRFDEFKDYELGVISALAAVSLDNALKFERLEQGDSKVLFNGKQNTLVEQQEIIGKSKQIQSIINEVELIANSDVSVLILGETGTGKELIARTIHTNSPRASAPFVYLNCAGLSDTVAESELFGHVKGAFTGAVNERKGKIEAAEKGTLYLDEISELPLYIQTKLQHAIQNRVIQRIGDSNLLPVDIRVIAATNKELSNEVSQGNFRADLYNRINIFPIKVPPLRVRKGDAIVLAGYYCEKLKNQMNIEHVRISNASARTIDDYYWPGNVRELAHTLKRALISARAEQSNSSVEIHPHHLDIKSDNFTAEIQSITSVLSASDLTLPQATYEFQYFYVEQALARANGNWSKAADFLGVDKGNLHRLAKRLGLK